MFNGRQLKQGEKTNPLQNPLSLCISHMCMLQILLKNRQKTPQFNKNMSFLKWWWEEKKLTKSTRLPPWLNHEVTVINHIFHIH